MAAGDERGVDDPELAQQTEWCIALSRSGQLLEHLRTKIGCGFIARPDPRGDRPARIAHQVHAEIDVRPLFFRLPDIGDLRRSHRRQHERRSKIWRQHEPGP